jgi:hypothetical protein
MTYLSQASLITAILRELDAQEPGCTVTQRQMTVIVKAANQIEAAMVHKLQQEAPHDH